MYVIVYTCILYEKYNILMFVLFEAGSVSLLLLPLTLYQHHMTAYVEGYVSSSLAAPCRSKQDDSV